MLGDEPGGTWFGEGNASGPRGDQHHDVGAINILLSHSGFIHVLKRDDPSSHNLVWGRRHVRLDGVSVLLQRDYRHGDNTNSRDYG